MFPALVERLERDELRPPVAATFPLERIAQAQTEFLEKRHVGSYALVPPGAPSALRRAPHGALVLQAHVAHGRARRVRGRVGQHPLRGALGVEPRAVVLDLVAHRGLVPLQHRRHQPRDVVDGAAAAILRLEGDVRAAREHVVHVQRRLVEHREPDLGGEVRVRAVQRRSQRRVLDDEVQDPQRQRAVPAREVVELRGREARRAGMEAGPVTGLRRPDGAEQGHVLRVARRHA